MRVNLKRFVVLGLLLILPATAFAWGPAGHKIVASIAFRQLGEAGFKLPNGSCFWQVDASKDGQVILATADSQGKAWWECLRLAGVVECEGGYSAKTGGMLLCRSPRSVTAPTK